MDNNGYYKITTRKEGNCGKLLHRLIYEDYFNIKIPYGFVIHHIDEDPTNNQISNLMMMPRELHSKLHHKNKYVSPETCNKISESLKGLRVGENHPLYGKHHSIETRAKISQSHIGFTHSDETCEKMSKNKSVSGYFRVHMKKCKTCKQGFIWRYQYYDEDKNRKSIESTDLKKLEEKVIKKGLKWLKMSGD